MYYKVTVKKELYVQADNKDDAEDKVFNEDFILCDERIIDVKEVSSKQVIEVAYED